VQGTQSALQQCVEAVGTRNLHLHPTILAGVAGQTPEPNKSEERAVINRRVVERRRFVIVICIHLFYFMMMNHHKITASSGLILSSFYPLFNQQHGRLGQLGAWQQTNMVSCQFLYQNLKL
jgi:hypothetical protein